MIGLELIGLDLIGLDLDSQAAHPRRRWLEKPAVLLTLDALTILLLGLAFALTDYQYFPLPYSLLAVAATLLYMLAGLPPGASVPLRLSPLLRRRANFFSSSKAGSTSFKRDTTRRPSYDGSESEEQGIGPGVVGVWPTPLLDSQDAILQKATQPSPSRSSDDTEVVRCRISLCRKSTMEFRANRLSLPLPLLNNLLSTRPFVYIGKLSYPLYLWHWPIGTVHRSNH